MLIGGRDDEVKEESCCASKAIRICSTGHELKVESQTAQESPTTETNVQFENVAWQT